MKEFFLTGRAIFYRMNDFRADRRSIVFIHGVTGSCSAWFEYEEFFKDKYNLLTLDLRGHGCSFKRKELDDYAVEQCAEDVSEILKQASFGQFIIVSHSFGTLVAIELLQVHGNRVEAAIFLSPAYNLQDAKSKSMVPILKLATAVFRVFPFSSAVRGRTDYSRFRNTGDWNLRRMFADIRNTSLRAHLFCLMQIYRYDQSNKWTLPVPVLVIHGLKDTLIPVEHARWLKAARPLVKLIILERGDHIIILNNAAEICRAISEFIFESLPKI